MPLGLLLRRGPVSRARDFDRGTPIDRHFIEGFVAASAADIRGRVLEVKDAYCTGKYGRSVKRADVLDVDAGNSHATIIADLAAAQSIPADTFDCFILTKTLHLIFTCRLRSRVPPNPASRRDADRDDAVGEPLQPGTPTQRLLAQDDPLFSLIVTIRAVKA